MDTLAPIPPHRTEIRVRYNECDPMGVAHHAVYPVWFEIGRTELLRAANRIDYRELESRGYLLAIVKLEVRYKRPARYDDLLTLHTTLNKTSHVKIEHSYELFRGKELLATASSTLACLDRDGRPQSLPAELLSGAE